MLAGNGFDRMPAGLKTAIGGKTGNKGGVSGHCAVMWRRFRGAQGEKRIRLTANGGGRDEKGRLFVLHSFISVWLIEAEAYLLASMVSILRRTRMRAEIDDLRATRSDLVTRVRELVALRTALEMQRIFEADDFGKR
jgi:hypothetical protein